MTLGEFDPRVDYYAALGVGSNASHDEIAKAYHALAARYHPDKHQGNELEELAREKLAAINAAFAVVGNPDRRARYDAARRGGGASSPGDAAGGRPGPATGAAGRTHPVLWIILAAAGLFLLWRSRSWRVLAVFAAVVAALWLVPRLVRYFRR